MGMLTSGDQRLKRLTDADWFDEEANVRCFLTWCYLLLLLAAVVDTGCNGAFLLWCIP